MKLCVFPNDPITAYYEKGEIKDRYYNPKNFFSEIHIISFTEKDIDEIKVQKIVGNAKLKIYSVGRINLLNKNSKKNKVLKIIKQINPDVIRSYNALLEGWIGAKCSQEYNIPFFVSLHVQYDTKRKFEKQRNYKKYLALKYYRKSIEPFVLKIADKITIVYKIIEPYVIEMCQKKPEILYNRINLEKFQKRGKIFQYGKPTIITVGRLTSRKNHDCLINAIKDLDVILLIIGDGEEYENLINLSNFLKLENRIKFIKSVNNDKIQDYYNSADLFVSMYNPSIEGIPIPVLEAMASGLPVIVSKPIENLSDGLEDSVIFSEIKPESVKKEILRILENNNLKKELSQKALKKAKSFDGNNTEQREAEIYEELIKGKYLGDN